MSVMPIMVAAAGRHLEGTDRICGRSVLPHPDVQERRPDVEAGEPARVEV
ncbi:hypothetical protein NY547_06625 [Cnuibacter physcomitrellae]|nr:hypothetical protein [Cnuibacter physcomitrellae]MCS5496909.1 hypothetical protein [Cnuibacter physcomitrellae]